MLQLRTTIDGSKKFIDLYGNEDITIELSVAEIQDITKRNSTFTQAFKVPGSKNNNDIFNHFYDFAATTIDFDVRRKFDAEITKDGYILFEGYIRLNSVSRTNEEIIYDVTFYSEVGNVMANIGDKFLAELDLSDLEHTYSDTIRDSYYFDPDLYGPGSYPYTDGNLYYGLLHRGYIYTGVTFDDTGVNYVETPILDWSFTGFTGTTPITQVGYFDDVQTPLQYEYLTPMIQVKKMYEEIFSQAGYQINSDFFDTAYFKRYYFPLTVLSSDNIYLNQSVQPCFRFSASGDPVSYSAYTFTDVYTGNESSWRLPVSAVTCDNISAATGSNYFTLEQNGYYFGRLTWTGRNQESPDTVNLDSYVKFKIRKQDVPISVDVRSGTTEYSTITYTVEPLERIVNQSTTFIIDKNLILDNYALDVVVTGNGDFILEDIDFHIYNGPRYVIGDMNPALELPEDNYKQLEFIQAVNQQFNLLVMPEVSSTKTFRVEPVIDWFGKGETLDWTSKVDRTSSINVQPLTEMIEGTVEFNYQDDSGWANSTYKQETNKIFSINKVQLNQDYKDKITNFSSIIGSHIDKVSNSTPQVGYGTIPYFFTKVDKETEEGTPIPEFNPYRTTPKILFRSALITTDTFGENSASGTPYNHQFYVEDTSFQVWANNNRFITYPFGISGLSHYHQFKGYDTFDTQELIFDTSENLYDIYYKDYIEDLTNENNRLVSCKMYFTPEELSELKWNEKIFVDGTIFRVNKISNYSLLNEGLADVELVKLTKEYESHRVLYYQLDVCTGGTVYSNSDLQWSLYAYQGKYINTEEYGRVGVFLLDSKPEGATFETVTLIGTSSSYGFKPEIYSGCSGSYSFRMNVINEYDGDSPTTPPNPTPTPTPSVTPTISVTPTSTPAPTPTNTRTPTLTPTPSPSTQTYTYYYIVNDCDNPMLYSTVGSNTFYPVGKVLKLSNGSCAEITSTGSAPHITTEVGSYTDCGSCPR